MDFNDAVIAYFKGYNVCCHQQPTLNNEFRNPLFLKTLCEAYQGRTLPSGTLTFLEVIRAWERRIAENIEQLTDCPTDSTSKAISEIIGQMSISPNLWLSESETQVICKRHFSDDTKSKGLYYKLLSEGFIAESVIDDSITHTSETHVRLQYERFSDIRIIENVLDGISTKEDWLTHWRTEFLPKITMVDFQGKTQLHWNVAPKLFALALILPEKFGIELVECPLRPIIHRDTGKGEYWVGSFEHDKKQLWSAWLDSLSWRKFQNNSDKVKRLFLLWANKLSHNGYDVYSKLFEFACIPSHPFNADFLHRHLKSLTLSNRDVRWSALWAHQDFDDVENGVIGEFFNWVDGSTGLLSDEQMHLALIPLLWLTSSSNRGLRNKATDIAIRVLNHRPEESIVMGLCHQFLDVNDPYVKERLLAVLCGALPVCKSDVVRKLAEYIEEHFWSSDIIEPNIMIRDYAEFIVRFAYSQGLITNECILSIENRSTYPMPDIWTEEQVKFYEDDSIYHDIASSLRPESTRMYGDFGRYVMGNSVHQFIEIEKLPEKREKGDRSWIKARSDDKKVRRYIWQRIINLGWTPEKFGEFENNLREFGHERPRIERISKKYQWIALFEYLGLLTDSAVYLGWNDSPRIIKSFSELEKRNYNPSIAVLPQIEQDDERDNAHLGQPKESHHFNSLPVELIPKAQDDNARKAWVAAAFNDMRPFLFCSKQGKEWVCLLGSWHAKEPLDFGENWRSAGMKMEQWIHVRAMVLPTKGHQKILDTLKNERFFGNGLEVPENRQAWLSEYPWKDSFREIESACAHDDRLWRDKGDTLNISLLSCEVQENIILPNPMLYRGVSDVIGNLTAPIINPLNHTVEIQDHNAQQVFISTLGKEPKLFVEKENLLKWLSDTNQTMFWCVLSEKSAYDHSLTEHTGGIADQVAIYIQQPKGNTIGGLIPQCYQHQIYSSG